MWTSVIIRKYFNIAMLNFNYDHQKNHIAIAIDKNKSSSYIILYYELLVKITNKIYY